MNEKVEVRYQSVIVDENKQKQTIKYQETGELIKHKTHRELTFETKENLLIKILFSSKKVVLKQGQSVLELVLQQKVKNNYRTMYGMMELDICLLKFQETNNQVKVVYEIYQNDSFVSKVYINITMNQILLN